MNIAGAQTLDFKTLLMPGKLIEGHADLERDCANCHVSFEKTAQDRLCLDCHEDIAEDIDTQRGFHGRQPHGKVCTQCHTDHEGRNADVVRLNKDSFDHNQTDFELTGKHKQVACNSCHEPGLPHREAFSVCFDCHKKDDRHQGNLGESCDDCHSSKAWSETQFDHDTTDFPLKGGHKDTRCNSCHPDDRYKDIATTCFSCHVLNDVHTGQNGRECDLCHRESDWKTLDFDHRRDTDFPLRGKHQKLICEACHKEAKFEKSPGTACFDCHQHDDPHQGRNGQECDNCHRENGWSELLFDHGKDTKFALSGKHADVDCESCHRGEKQKENLKTDCYSCHALDDIHKGQQGKTCERCHNADDWAGEVVFDHDLTTFPLLGMHGAAPCEACHLGGAFKGTSNECADCHREDDDHKGALGPDCHRCHNPNGWQTWSFDHNRQTEFELDGAHQDLACNACHKKPVRSEVRQSSACVTCHRDEDPHDGGFGRYCDRCHITEDFQDVGKLRRR